MSNYTARVIQGEQMISEIKNEVKNDLLTTRSPTRRCDSRSFPKSVLPVVHPLYYSTSCLLTGRRNKCDTFSTAAL